MEAQLAHGFQKLAPSSIGSPYLVLGTIDRKRWKSSLTEGDRTVAEMLQYTADFHQVLELHVKPGGWFPAGKESG